MQYRVVKRGGKYSAMSYKTKEAVMFQKHFTEYVKEQALLQNWEYDDNPFQHYYVDAVFYFPRIDMDTNNYWKCTFDAITDSEVVWVDDNMAQERVLGVYYDAKNPRIELTIRPTENIGIFESKGILDMFENDCKKCSRYSRNCSILKGAKEGRVQEYIDIETYLCEKFKGIKGEN